MYSTCADKSGEFVDEEDEEEEDDDEDEDAVEKAEEGADVSKTGEVLMFEAAGVGVRRTVEEALLDVERSGGIEDKKIEGEEEVEEVEEKEKGACDDDTEEAEDGNAKDVSNGNVEKSDVE